MLVYLIVQRDRDGKAQGPHKSIDHSFYLSLDEAEYYFESYKQEWLEDADNFPFMIEEFVLEYA